MIALGIALGGLLLLGLFGAAVVVCGGILARRNYYTAQRRMAAALLGQDGEFDDPDDLLAVWHAATYTKENR